MVKSRAKMAASSKKRAKKAVSEADAPLAAEEKMPLDETLSAPTMTKKKAKADEKAAKMAGKKKGKGAAKKDKRNGVMYIGHVPHGFYESQMKQFLSQYGKVIRLRLSRSKKTGKSHGYAFAQFQDNETAESVAHELNGQYLTGKVLNCSAVPPEKVHPNIWKGMKTSDLQKKDEDIRVNGPLVFYQTASTKAIEPRLMDLVTRERALNQKLKDAGIEYEFHGFEEQLAKLGVDYVPRAKNQQAVPPESVAAARKKKASKEKSQAGKKAPAKKATAKKTQKK